MNKRTYEHEHEYSYTRPHQENGRVDLDGLRNSTRRRDTRANARAYVFQLVVVAGLFYVVVRLWGVVWHAIDAGLVKALGH